MGTLPYIPPQFGPTIHTTADVADPSSTLEWRTAAAIAEFYVEQAACQRFGLTDAAGRPNLERCEDVLRAARARGLTPLPLGQLCVVHGREIELELQGIDSLKPEARTLKLNPEP